MSYRPGRKFGLVIIRHQYNVCGYFNIIFIQHNFPLLGIAVFLMFSINWSVFCLFHTLPNLTFILEEKRQNCGSMLLLQAQTKMKIISYWCQFKDCQCLNFHMNLTNFKNNCSGKLISLHTHSYLVKISLISEHVTQQAVV